MVCETVHDATCDKRRSSELGLVEAERPSHMSGSSDTTDGPLRSDTDQQPQPSSSFIPSENPVEGNRTQKEKNDDVHYTSEF